MGRPFIRNWRDQQPANSHGAVGWKILTERGEGKPYETSPLVGIHGLTFRMLQAGMVEPAHSHEAKEHVYYIIKGRGKVQLGDDFHAVADGDAVYMPAQGRHSIVNDSEEFIEHLVISAIALLLTAMIAMNGVVIGSVFAFIRLYVPPQ